MSSASVRVEKAIDVIRGEAMEHGFVPGGQVACWVLDEGDVATVSIGADARGTPLEPGSLSASYCMAKPIVALLYGELVGRGEVSLDDRLGDVLPCSGSAGSFTVADYLAHEVRLDVPDGSEAVMSRPEEYRDRLRAAGATAGPVPRYSELAAWRLLALAAEEVVGEPLAAYVAAHILGPVGASDDVWLGPWSAGDGERMRVNGAMAVPGRFTPLLVERGGWMDWSTNPGFGGYLSAAGMVKVVGAVLRSRRGGGLLDPEVAAALTVPGPVHDDEVVQRRCRFGRGLFCDMRSFDLEHLVSERSFGQVGLMGMSAVVADPDRSIVAAYHLSAYTDTETMGAWLRPAIMGPLLA